MKQSIRLLLIVTSHLHAPESQGGLTRRKGKGATSGFVEKVGDARTMMIPWIEIPIAIAIITVIRPAQH